MNSLWSATAISIGSLPQLTGQVRAEVVVVGGGYTGLSAALHLSEAGRDVVVLEAADIGEHASGQNGGQVIPGLKDDPDTLETLFGTHLGSQLVTTVASGPDVVFEIIRRYGISCEPTRTGWIQPATSEEALARLSDRVAQWRRRDAPVELLTRAQTARLTGSERYCGGWIDRRGGTVQPLSYVRGLARAAQGAGTRIFTHTSATGLVRSGQEWRIDTPRGCVASPLVILATDAYTDRLVDGLRRTIVAVPSFQVATVPIPQRLIASILPERQSASDTWHLLRYFRLDRSGRLVMGTRGYFADVPVHIAARPHYRAVAEIYPQLAGIEFEYHWGGLVAMTRDHLPHLHEIAPGLLAGLGYNGRGVAMATVMGQLLARRALGESQADLGFPITPVRPIPFHRFNRLGARTAIQILRALDGVAMARQRWFNRRRPA